MCDEDQIKLTNIMSRTSCVYVRSPPLRVIMSHFSGVHTMTCVAIICSLFSWWSPVNSSTWMPYELRRWQTHDTLTHCHTAHVTHSTALSRPFCNCLPLSLPIPPGHCNKYWYNTSRWWSTNKPTQYNASISKQQVVSERLWVGMMFCLFIVFFNHCVNSIHWLWLKFVSVAWPSAAMRENIC